MWSVFSIALSLLLVLPPAPQPAHPQKAPAAKAQPKTSKIWIGRYAEFEEYLRTAAFERFEDTDVGVTRPRHGFFAPGGLAGGATVKNLPPRRQRGFFESYKSEIAAYKLDRLLQLDMVPPTVERRVDGDLMSVQLWVDDVDTIKHVQEKKLHAPNPASWNRDVYRQRVFDNLVANIDRNQGNLLLDPIWNLILIDHSRAFTAIPTMPFPMTKIDRDFYEKLKALDETTLKARLGKLLYYGPKPLLQRRDEIVKVFQDKIAQYGEAAVLTN